MLNRLSYYHARHFHADTEGHAIANAALSCFDTRLWAPTTQDLYATHITVLWPCAQDYEQALKRYIYALTEGIMISPEQVPATPKRVSLHLFFLDREKTYLEPTQSLDHIQKLSLALLQRWQPLIADASATTESYNSRTLAPVAHHLRSLFRELIDYTHHAATER